MGTNYYLIRKMEYREGIPVSLGCTSADTEVEKLTNGWVLRDTYYSTLEELSKDFTQEIHIGKSSYGWHFSLCVYPEFGINNLEDWMQLFNEPGNKIVNDYGDQISIDDMITIITVRKAPKWKDDPISIKNYEEQVIESTNEFAVHFGGRMFSTYDEILEQNHAERGVNGLWAHKRDRFHKRGPLNSTYDYVISGNDPNSCCIFS